MVLLLQPGDDIVFMAQELEKVFLQKVVQMPSEEKTVLNKGKKRGKKTDGKKDLIDVLEKECNNKLYHKILQMEGMFFHIQIPRNV